MSIPKAWKNKGKILEGIKNRLFLTSDIREVADERLKICNKCPHLDKKGKECLIPGTQPCCALCGCSMGIKAYAMSSACDDNRWSALMTEEEEDELNDQLNNE